MRAVESYSAMAAFMDCPRMYQITRLSGLARVDEDSVNKQVHRGLQGESTEGFMPHAIAAVKGWERHLGPPEGDQILYEEEFVLTIGIGTPGLGERMKIVMDGLVRNSDGTCTIWEIKTTQGRMDKMHLQMEGFRARLQTIMYRAAMEALGVPVREVVYDLVRIPTLRQKKTESDEDYAQRLMDDALEKPEHYMRWSMQHSRQEIHDGLLDMHGIMDMMETCSQKDFWPRNTTKCNYMYGKECEFKAMCGTGTID